MCPEKGSEAVRGLEHKSYGEQLRELVQSVEEEAQRRPHCTLCNYLKGGCGDVVVNLFSHVTCNRTRGNGLKLCRGRFMLHIRKNFYCRRVIKH